MALGWLNKSTQQALAPKPTSIIDVLSKNLSGWKPARSHKKVHASDITKENFCPRQVCLLLATGKNKKDEYISAALQATFDVGNATGDMVPEEWAGDAAYGNWECRRCGHRSTFTSKPAIKCKHTDHKKNCDFKYEEVTFISKEYDVVGNIDVFFDLGGLKKVVTELKIMNVGDFEKLAAPLAEHRIRTALYLKLVEDSSHPFKSSINLQYGKVLYVSRGFGKKDADSGKILPFKEFDVARDDAIIQPYLDKALAVKKYKDGGPIPKGLTCTPETDKRCKGCAVMTECMHKLVEDAEHWE